MKIIPIFTSALEMRYTRIMRYFLGLHTKKYVIFIQKKKNTEKHNVEFHVYWSVSTCELENWTENDSDPPAHLWP